MRSKKNISTLIIKVKKNASITHVLILATGFFIGVIATQWSYFSLNKNINADQIVVALATCFTAIYVGKIIGKQLNKESSKKGIFVNEFYSILKILDNLDEHVMIDKQSHQLIISIIERLSKRIQSLNTLSSHHKGNFKLLSTKKFIVKIRQTLTDNPISQNGEMCLDQEKKILFFTSSSSLRTMIIEEVFKNQNS